MDNVINGLHDAGVAMDHHQAELDFLWDTLCLLMEGMEKERENHPTSSTVSGGCVERMPRYMSALHVVSMRLCEIKEGMRMDADGIFEAYKREQVAD